MKAAGHIAIATPVSVRVWRWSLTLLAAICWVSAFAFALFIFAYYGGAVVLGTMDEWNETLPRLYVAGGAGANAMIGLHFAFGALLLLAGPIQLMASVRARWPRVHRWIGWTYAPAALLTGLGGCLYILARGTVGGWPMTAGFFLYGALVVLSAVQTLRHALARDFETHRAWAIRLFALTIGSWLYRMDYGLMFAVFGPMGHTNDFSGWFDHVMDFWFYIPNLIVAELAIRGHRARAGHGVRWAGAGAFLAASLLIGIGTYFFVAKQWGPVILWRLGVIA